MKNASLHELTVAQLVERFADICAKQNTALLRDEIAKFNRLFDQMSGVEVELKSRDGDQRLALVSLFNHTDMQVRLQAAKSTLAVAPEVARQMLQRIEEWGRQPQAGDAGMCLWNLARGVFVPK